METQEELFKRFEAYFRAYRAVREVHEADVQDLPERTEIVRCVGILFTEMSERTVNEVGLALANWIKVAVQIHSRIREDPSD